MIDRPGNRPFKEINVSIFSENIINTVI